MSKLIQHHVKYEELHGVDEIKLMTVSEHRKLHHKLRLEGKCNISPNDLHNISMKAYRRTDKSKKYHRDRKKRFGPSQWEKEYCSNYRKQYRKRHSFCKTIKPFVVHVDEVTYNTKIDSVHVTSRFQANHGKKLYYIDI